MENQPVNLEIRLLVPKSTTVFAATGESEYAQQKSDSEIEVSIVVPALNEALTIGMFIDWCKEGLQKANVVGEILIVDSSTDNTAEIALAKGARVLKTPKRGLGQAYIDSIDFIRGKYIIMGDCDCTYDFRELMPFVTAFRNGAEYIMGSRFKGYIETGAMPPLHQYFGTPLTTWILNFIYGSHFTDIHCGMRGITKSALLNIQLQSRGWEYASELVLKSVHFQLKTAEVPIKFYKDQEGRLSHHRRSGWWSPWQAGWINLKAMFIYGPSFFLFKPGLFFLFLGSMLTIPLIGGPVKVGDLTFSIYWMLLGLAIFLFGLQCIYMSILSDLILDFRNAIADKWIKVFSYDRSTLISGLLLGLGISFNIPLVNLYFSSGLSLPSELHVANYCAVFGLLLSIVGFMNFTFTLVIHAFTATRGRNVKR